MALGQCLVRAGVDPKAVPSPSHSCPWNISVAVPAFTHLGQTDLGSPISTHSLLGLGFLNEDSNGIPAGVSQSLGVMHMGVLSTIPCTR